MKTAYTLCKTDFGISIFKKINKLATDGYQLFLMEKHINTFKPPYLVNSPN